MIDASFSGVSTQYLVDVPGVGVLSVFSQNLGIGTLAKDGDQVDAGLDAGAHLPAQRRRGSQRRCRRGHQRGRPVSQVTVAAATNTPPPGETVAPPPEQRRGRKWTPYLLLLPGLVWLLVFFVFPLAQLGATSLQSQFPGYPGYYYRDLNFSNFTPRGLGLPVVLRPVAALRRAGNALRVLPGLSAGLHDRVQGRPLAWRDADLHHRAVLHLVHPADDRLAADPLRRRRPVVHVLRFVHILPSDGHLTETWVAVVAGITYNFVPFMTLPIYAVARTGRPSADRGRRETCTPTASRPSAR